MSTVTAPRQQTPAQNVGADEAAKLLDVIMQQQPSASGRAVASAFERNISTIRDLLPPDLKPHAERFVKRALLYFERPDDKGKKKFADCTTVSKITAILAAAELGLPIDGKLCYCIPYGNVATLSIDYKGLIAVARRSGQIKDAKAEIVRFNDQFEHGRNGAERVLKHSYPLSERGDVIGAYVILQFPDGRWEYELLQVDRLEQIRLMSKQPNGIAWSKSRDEMYKKSVIRVGLKTYCDDPGLSKAIEIADMELGSDNGDWIAPSNKVRVTSLAEQLRGSETKPVQDESPGIDGQELPQFDRSEESNESTSTEESRTAPPPDEYLCDIALDFEAKLNDPAIKKSENLNLLQGIMAIKAQLKPFEFEHLKKLVDRNNARLK